MKKLIAGVMALALLASCGNKKTGIDPFASLTNEVDSALHRADTLHRPKAPEEPKPTEADESFDDFIYNFASDDELQRQRVKFPLSYYNGDEPSKIDKKYWKHDDLFTKQNYYTLLFDREEDMDLVGDTTLTSVQVEWIFIRTHKMKKYYFERIKGAWILEAIDLRPLEKGDNELAFVTTDPDDDFSVLETTLDLNQWFAFKPELPTDRLSNINYGQKSIDDSNVKIVALKGIGNGLSNILYFKRKERSGDWELYKFEDVSI